MIEHPEPHERDIALPPGPRADHAEYSLSDPSRMLREARSARKRCEGLREWSQALLSMEGSGSPPGGRGFRDSATLVEMVRQSRRQRAWDGTRDVVEARLRSGLAFRPQVPIRVTRRFPAVLTTSQAARAFVRAQCATLGRTDLTTSVTLLASELVTNAVIHARSDLEVVVTSSSHRIYVAVTDRAESMPEVATPHGNLEEHGFGLALVSGLADAWGVVAREGGKTVWFALNLRP